MPHHHYTIVGIKYLLCAPSRPQRQYCFSLTDIRRQTLFLTSVHRSVAVRWTLWEHPSQIQPSCNCNPAINDSALPFCSRSHPFSATAPFHLRPFSPQIQVPSGIPFASHTKQNYVMIYPCVHTRQLSGRGGYTQGAGGKADVKSCHSRLMGAGGERKSQIYSGGLPGWPLHCQTEPRRLI